MTQNISDNAKGVQVKAEGGTNSIYNAEKVEINNNWGGQESEKKT